MSGLTPEQFVALTLGDLVRFAPDVDTGGKIFAVTGGTPMTTLGLSAQSVGGPDLSLHVQAGDLSDTPLEAVSPWRVLAGRWPEHFSVHDDHAVLICEASASLGGRGMQAVVPLDQGGAARFDGNGALIVEGILRSALLSRDWTCMLEFTPSGVRASVTFRYTQKLHAPRVARGQGRTGAEALARAVTVALFLDDAMTARVTGPGS